MSITYDYSVDLQDQIHREIGKMMPPGTVKKATLPMDFGGTDGTYTINYHAELQIRVRYDRPVNAPEEDITFRTTELRMMEAGTYAPLMAFFWTRNKQIVAGKLIDVYRIYKEANPPLSERRPIQNFDGRTAFITVRISELLDTRALLVNGGPNGYAITHIHARQYLKQIIDQ